MSKILIMPSNKKQFELDCDGIIVGIKGLSTNITCFELKDLKNIKKDIFVSLNKNMFNSDIEYLKKTMLELNLAFKQLKSIDYETQTFMI